LSCLYVEIEQVIVPNVTANSLSESSHKSEFVSAAVAGLFYAAIVSVYLWPALTGQKVLLPTDLLYRHIPWAATRPPELGQFTNLALTDPVQQMYPWMHLAAGSVKSGRIPYWNPFAFAGTPFLANPQVALFAPFSLPFWVFPLPYAFGFAAGCKVWVAAFGMFLFARQLGCRQWAALFAGSAFGLSPFLIVWLSHPVSGVFAWLPACLYFIDRFLVQGGRGSLAGLALVVAALNLSGHPGSQLHSALALVVYGVVRMTIQAARKGWPAVRMAATAAAAVAMGFAVSALEWLPFAYALPGSNGVAVRAGGGGILPFEALIGAIIPDWWGHPTGSALPGGPANYNERVMFVGILSVLLVGLGRPSAGSWRRWTPTALLLLVGLFVPFGLSPVREAVVNLPGLANTNNLRLLGVFHLGAVALAALSLEHLLDSPVAMRRALWMLPVLLVLQCSLLWSATGGASWFDAVRVAQAPAVFDATTAVLRAAGGVRAAAVTLGLLLALLVGRVWGRQVAIVSVTLLAVGELLTFDWRYQPLSPPEYVWHSTPPAITYLQENAADSRVSALGNAMFPEASTVYRLRDIRGYSAPQPGARLAHLLATASPNLGTSDMVTFPALTPETARLFDILAVRLVLTGHEGLGATSANYREAYSGNDGKVFENAGARHRVFVPGRVLTAANEDQSLAHLMSSDFRPQVDAVVETSIPQSDVGVGAGTATIVRDELDELILQCKMDRGGLVVVADSWDLGWSVTVDRHPAPVLRVDSVLRGVAVPAGAHRVAWRYDPPGFRAAMVVSVLSLCAIVGVFFAGVGNRRRHTDGQNPSVPSPKFVA
jgi:hypothetical protein